METAPLFLLVISVFCIESIASLEIKVCEKSLWQLTLTRLNDVPGKNRWLGNISSVAWPQPLDKLYLELRLSTHGYNVDIERWNRDIVVKRTASTYPPIKHDASKLVNPRDIAYYSEMRVGNTFAIEASGADITDKYLAFVIGFDEVTALPVVEYLSVLDIEVCTLPEEIAFVRNDMGSCGLRVRKHLALFAGGSTHQTDWPWHAAIFESVGGKQTYKCGGTLINSRTVLTAAHCVTTDGTTQPLVAANVIVYLGVENLDEPGPSAQIVRAERIIVHSSFDAATYIDDMALIRFDKEVTFNEYVQPICLWHPDRTTFSDVGGKYAFIVGYTPRMNSASVYIFSDIICSYGLKDNVRKAPERFYPKHFCARVSGDVDKVCSLDTGAGIYFEHNGIFVLHGVAAITSEQCTTFSLIVSNDVSYYLDWIQENMDSSIAYDARIKPTEVKVCESGPVRLALSRLNDKSGKNRWLGNITASELLLSQRIEFKLELSTPGKSPQILDYDRSVETLAWTRVSPSSKYDPPTLVSPRDIAYYSDRRSGYSYIVEAADTSSANSNQLAFVIEFVEAAAFPIIGRLSVLGIEVCPPPAKRRSDKPPCGARTLDRQQLITSGLSTREGDWPWHCAIFHSRGPQQTYQCGCTLINSNTVLTAGHCVNTGGPGQTIIAERVFVHLGQYDIDLPTSTTQIFRAHRIIAHPDFDFSTLHNDIALIRLSTEATFTEYVQPICLWDSDRVELNQVLGRNGIAVGWGFNEYDQLLKTLNQVSMPIVSFADCLTSNPSFFAKLLTANTFCAGFRNGSGVCNGDSGGGMYFEENGIFKIRGVVSVTKARSSIDSACDRKEFVIFTDVARFLPWIKENSK